MKPNITFEEARELFDMYGGEGMFRLVNIQRKDASESIPSLNEANIQSVNAHLDKALEILESHIPYSKDGSDTDHLTYIFKEMLNAACLGGKALQMRAGI